MRGMRDFLREGLRMKDFNHANVLDLIGISFNDDNAPLILIPFMANGDLDTWMRDRARM